MTVEWRGVVLDQRTSEMISEVARLMADAPGGDVYIRPTQGSYNKGGVAASAGTHDGGGVLDVDTDPMSVQQRDYFISVARKVGFAAWYRTQAQGFTPHAHLVAVNCPDLSSGALQQVRDYFDGLNGLARRGLDDATRAFVGATWEKYQASKIREVIIVTNVWLMQSDTATVYLVREDCTGKVALPSVQVASDVLFILQAGGVKVMNPPKAVPRGDVAGRPVWAGVRPETLQAIPTL